MAVDYRPQFDPADVDSDYGQTGSDITVPTFKGDTRPFRFWCQRALPLVYDDSLSYYEVLCKVVNYLNNFMSDLSTVEGSITEFSEQFVINQKFLNDMANQLGQNVQDLEDYINDRMDDFTAAYTQLQTYVNTYFDNLDVQTEINAKLDEMAEDGTFNNLFDPVISAWMTTKTAQIDQAINEQNQTLAAQNNRISILEGRMDTFSSLPSGSTSGNAELLGIRTNFLGETYASAGDAVRASDMIASGFESIPFTRLTDWNGNSENLTEIDTAQFDVSSYKGGKVCFIASFSRSVENIIQDAVGMSIFGSNVSGKTADPNATQYPFPNGYSGFVSDVFMNYVRITTDLGSNENRYMLQLSIPEDFAYQYLKIGYLLDIDRSGAQYTEPAVIVYATSWSKTKVDSTLTVSGEAADAAVTGSRIDEVNERLNTTLQRFGYVINDAWLTANNISDVKQLTKNRVYLLTGVTKTNLTSMPTTSGTSYNGALVIFDQVSPGMTPLLFFDNVGKLYSGVNIESAIRWIENATSANISSLIASIQSLETSAFRTFGTQITDSWLSANNKDDVRELTVNYCYIINNVTKANLANMPEISASAYNGALLYFKQQSPAFQPLFFIDNLGTCWSGIDTGTTIRWKSLTQTYQTINDALYRFYNKKILILGDSIVYGSHMTDYQAGNRTVVTLEDETVYKNNLSTTVWSYKFAQYITANYGMTVVNNAYPGARFQDLITYYDQLVDDTYDFVLICMGVNNWNSGGQVIPTLTTLKSRFDAMGAKMLVMTPLGSTTYALATGMIRGFIKEWGLNANKEVGDLYSNFNEINYLQGHTLSDVLLDGVHYNDASQTGIFEAVKKTLNL